jgi:hypothetical protein
MNRKRIAAQIAAASALVLPAALIAAPQAHAQGLGKGQLMVQVGGNYLTDGDSRDATNDIGIHAGLGYMLPSTGSGHSSIDLDYNNNTGHGNRVTTIAAMFVQRTPMTPNVPVGGGMAPYYGFGIGFGQIDVKATVESAPTTGEETSSVRPRAIDESIEKKKTRIVGKVLAGLNFGNSFAELSYNIYGSVEGAKADSIGLSVGTHF